MICFLGNISDIVIGMPFIKGHIGYNKGIHSKGEYIRCLNCGKERWIFQSRLLKGDGKYCSQDCSNKSTAKRGENSVHWKDSVGYYGVHSWLYTNYGSPSKCEKCGRAGDKNKYGKWNIHWSKLEGKEYSKNRDNFWALCWKCHMDYDGTHVKGGWNKGISWKDWSSRK